MVSPSPQGALQVAAATPGDKVIAGKIIKVGVYARISEDKSDDELGVGRQVRDGIKIAEVRGWTVHDHYIDNDLSASKWGVVRPDFNRLLQDLEDGVIQGIVGYDVDRLFRLPIDLERAIKVYDFHDDLVFATVQGDINLSSDDGITMARVMVAFANKESRNTARRVARKHAELRENGVPVGGNRPFGWKASPEAYQALAIAEETGNEAAIASAKATINYEGRRRKDPFESSLIIEGVNAILEGHGIYELAKNWNDSGYKAPRGGEWSQQSIRNVFMTGRIAGFRTHKREPALDENGNRVVGKFDHIVEVATWEAVHKVLVERARSKMRPKQRRYLLSGLIRCGRCGARMRSHRHSEGGYHNYVCDSKPGANSCGKGSIHGPKTDLHIEILWKAYISMQTNNGQGSIEPWPDEYKIGETESQITELMEGFKNKILPGARAFPMIQALELDLNSLRLQRAEWIQHQHQQSGMTANADDWDLMSITDRIVELNQRFSAIVIHPFVPGSKPRFEPGRIEPIWREYSEVSSGSTPQETWVEHSLDSEQATLQSS